MLGVIASAIESSTPGLLAAVPWKDILGLGAATGVVFGVQRLVPTYDQTFYKGLKKPTWNPPNWVFPAVWIPLKVMQSVALYLVAKNADPKYLPLPLAVFTTHLALGNWWNVVFFGRHKLRESLTWMGIFWGSVLASVASFYPASELAAGLVAPTSIWVTIAAKLNYDIWKLNGAPKQD